MILFYIDTEGLLVVYLSEVGVGVFPAKDGVHCDVKDSYLIENIKSSVD